MKRYTCDSGMTATVKPKTGYRKSLMRRSFFCSVETGMNKGFTRIMKIADMRVPRISAPWGHGGANVPKTNLISPALLSCAE
jgi:hypothetical protein